MKQRVSIKCRWCGKASEGQPHRRYCDGTCKQAAYNHRNRLNKDRNKKKGDRNKKRVKSGDL